MGWKSWVGKRPVWRLDLRSFSDVPLGHLQYQPLKVSRTSDCCKSPWFFGNAIGEISRLRETCQKFWVHKNAYWSHCRSIERLHGWQKNMPTCWRNRTKSWKRNVDDCKHSWRGHGQMTRSFNVGRRLAVSCVIPCVIRRTWRSARRALAAASKAKLATSTATVAALRRRRPRGLRFGVALRGSLRRKIWNSWCRPCRRREMLHWPKKLRAKHTVRHVFGKWTKKSQLFGCCWKKRQLELTPWHSILTTWEVCWRTAVQVGPRRVCPQHAALCWNINARARSFASCFPSSVGNVKKWNI